MSDTLCTWRLTRGRAWLVVALAWAAIFLPALGTLELQGNEAKRILPALHMLDGGSWITPELAGIKYYNKPPLMYWLIAASCTLTDARDEWAVRLPSVLAILAFVSLLVLRGRAWLGLKGRVCAALVFLTTVSFIEKGRQSEIDAAFVAITGCAVWWWLSAWGVFRTSGAGPAPAARARLWLPVAFLIGIGLLLKGPLLLLFVYAVILCVMAYEQRVRELWTWQHGAAVVLWLGMLLAWVIACKLENPVNAATTIWREEMGSRFVPDDFSLAGWIGSVLKVPVDFLPWFVFVPLLWWGPWWRAVAAEDQRVFRATRLALLLCFVMVNMLPGTKPRYSMPLFASASILVGWLIAAQPARPLLHMWWLRALGLAALVLIVAVIGALIIAPSGALSWLLQRMHAPINVPAPASAAAWLSALAVAGAITAGALWLLRQRSRYVRDVGDCLCATAGLMAAAMLAFAVFVMPFLTCNAIRQPAGAAITAAVPPEAVLHVFARHDLLETGYQPFLYYVPRTKVYCTNFVAAAQARFVLMEAHHTAAWSTASAALGTPMAARTNFVYKKDSFTVLGAAE